MKTDLSAGLLFHPIRSGVKLPKLAIRLLGLVAVVFLAAVPAAWAQPTITSIYPPVLTERAGDHVAFTVSATGSGTLSYQWFQNGTLLAGQTNGWIVLTNIQSASSGQYGVTVEDSTATFASNSATLNVSTGYLPLYPTNLVVLRLGDGVQALSGASGNTIYLDQYATSGAYISTVQVPDRIPGLAYGVGTNKTIIGNPALILPGAGVDAANQGVLTLSGDQQFITLGGYQLGYPYTGADVTAGGTSLIRGIYTVNAYGYPTLAYTNEGFYSGGNHTFRSAVTLDNTNFWTTGEAGSGGGVKYANITVASYAGGSGVPTISSSITGPRVVQIANGNLIFSDAAATGGHGLYVFAGIPTPIAGATTNSQLALNEGGVPNDFAISPDGNTIYIADGQPYTSGTAQAGGLQRWDYVNDVGYVFSYALAPSAGTNGAQNLTVDFPSSISTWGAGVTGAALYATLVAPTNNTIVSVVDNGAGSLATPLITAGPNQVLRGVRFGPSAVAGLGIGAGPQSQTAPLGNNVTFTVTPQGAPPFFYQWQYNGASIPGATQQAFTLTNVQFATAGNYSVIVSNPATFIASSNAVLSVVLGAPQFVSQPQSWVETAGDHLAFSVLASGTLPIGYQWYQNNAAIAGATNAALELTNIQSANAGSYYVVATNTYGSSNSIAATLAVTSALQILSSNNLVVARVGDGSEVLSSSTGNTLYLDQIATSGAYISSVQIPDQGAGLPYGYGSGTNASESINLPAGSKPIIFAGAGADAPYEALLTLSADGSAINFAGYVLAYPANVTDVTYVNETASGNSIINWRGLGGVSTYGYYSLDYTNAGLYTGGAHTIHSAVTLEGVNFWTAGEAGSDGIKFVSAEDPSYGTGIGVPTVLSSGPGPRVVQVVNGNLEFADADAVPAGIYAATGTPELAKLGTAASTLLINEGGSPVDFATSPDGQTVYISDDQSFGGSTVQAGGIQRWDSNGAGGYNYSYTLATSATNLAGARGLTAYFPASTTTWGAGVTGAIVYATTAETPNNRLISVVDTGASSVATTLRVSGANQTFTGLRFGPSPVAPGLYNQPQPTNAFAGQSVTLTAKAIGSTPYIYQWLLNGVAVAGATNATFTLTNLQSANAGGYALVVSNGAGSFTNAAVPVTVLPLPQLTAAANLGNGQGFQLSFNGPAGYNYSIWTSTNLGSVPIKSGWSRLVSGNTFSGGTDTYVDPNGGTAAGQFYVITVP